MFKYILFKYRLNIRSNIAQILGQKLVQIYTIPRYIKRKLKEYKISSGREKMRRARHLAQLFN